MKTLCEANAGFLHSKLAFLNTFLFPKKKLKNECHKVQHSPPFTIYYSKKAVSFLARTLQPPAPPKLASREK